MPRERSSMSVPVKVVYWLDYLVNAPKVRKEMKDFVVHFPTAKIKRSPVLFRNRAFINHHQLNT
jgi:hypothetical protein